MNRQPALRHGRHAAVLIALMLLSGSQAAPQAPVFTPRGLTFFAAPGGPNPPAQVVSVAASPGGAMAWTAATPSAAWISATPSSGRAPGSLTVAVDISGLPAGAHVGSVELAAGAQAVDQSISVLLIISSPGQPTWELPTTPLAPGAVLAEYEVEYRFEGFSGDMDVDDCPVNRVGFDVLRGTVRGWEDPARGENQHYTGRLQRSTVVDLCMFRPELRAGDEARLCATTVTGAAHMNILIEVYGEEDRGTFIRTRHDGGPAGSLTRGDCHTEHMLEVRGEYPGSSTGGGAMPSGTGVDDSDSPVKFFQGGLARLRVGTFPLVPEPNSWTLRVLRKIR